MLRSNELNWATLFTDMLAFTAEGAPTIQIRHLLGGLYIATEETLMIYFDNWPYARRLLIAMCELDQPRFAYWIEISSKLDSGRQSFVNKIIPYSKEAANVLEDAQGLAMRRVRSPDKAVLEVSDLLLALKRVKTKRWQSLLKLLNTRKLRSAQSDIRL